MSAIKLSDCQPLIVTEGSISGQEEVARILHVMRENPEVFTLVVQRRPSSEAERDPQQGLFREWLGEVDDESAACGIHIGRPTASNRNRLTASRGPAWVTQSQSRLNHTVKSPQFPHNSNRRLPGFRFGNLAVWLIAPSSRILCLPANSLMYRCKSFLLIL